jgi:hypothetical protein
MRTKIFLVIAFAGFTLSSCDKSNKDTFETALEARAQALGFEDTSSYIQFVQTNCSQDNHENCNILPNGEHHVCDNVNHKGQHRNGSRYRGTEHGNCGRLFRYCGSQMPDGGNH